MVQHEDMLQSRCATKHLYCFCCHSYIKGLLGGPTPAEHEALKQEKEDLKQQLATARQQLEESQAKVGCSCCFASHQSNQA